MTASSVNSHLVWSPTAKSMSSTVNFIKGDAQNPHILALTDVPIEDCILSFAVYRVKKNKSRQRVALFTVPIDDLTLEKTNEDLVDDGEFSVRERKSLLSPRRYMHFQNEEKNNTLSFKYIARIFFDEEETMCLQILIKHITCTF